MITKSEAEAIVQKWLDEHPVEDWYQGKLAGRIELAIARVDEFPWGWMFMYETKKCLQTGDFRDALVGNCPIFVTREDGAFHGSVTSSAFPPEEHARRFEALLSKK